MTKEEKIIATAFTGKMFIDGSEMGLLYEYMEKKLGHGVIDLMLASKEFWEELHNACEQDFIDMISKEQTPIPGNLDEAAHSYAWEKQEHHIDFDGDEYLDYGPRYDAFKAGAEWMAGQGITVDGTFHHSCGYPSVIELKTYLRDYEGADVIVTIRKK